MPSFRCDICGTLFSTHAGLERHMDNAQCDSNESLGYRRADKRFECEHCGKKFSQKANLKVHVMGKHTGGQKLFECDICGKAYGYYSALRTHKKKHTGEKPYACTQCPKRFLYRSSYCRHILVHAGYRPIPCEMCGKGFPTKTAMRLHQRVHIYGDGRKNKKAIEIYRKRDDDMKEIPRPPPIINPLNTSDGSISSSPIPPPPPPPGPPFACPPPGVPHMPGYMTYPNISVPPAPPMSSLAAMAALSQSVSIQGTAPESSVYPNVDLNLSSSSSVVTSLPMSSPSQANLNPNPQPTAVDVVPATHGTVPATVVIPSPNGAAAGTQPFTYMRESFTYMPQPGPDGRWPPPVSS